MDNQHRKVTSADVAAAAGVSRATVSFVLNRRADKQITERTRRAVLDAAEQLGYQPTASARTLRLGRSNLAMLLIPDWPTTEEATKLFDRIGDLLAECGLACVRYQGSQWKGHLADLWAAVTPAAAISFEPLEGPDETATRNAGIELIAAWLLDSPRGSHTTHLDQRDIARVQVEYLHGRGIDHVVFAAPVDPRHEDFAAARIKGFLEAVETLSLKSAQVRPFPEDIESGAREVRGWGSATAQVGVCAYSDLVAFAVLASSTAARLAVPDQIAVVGVDDIDAAKFSAPPLTTVRLNLEREAHRIAAAVAHSLGVELPASREPLGDTVELVQRASA